MSEFVIADCGPRTSLQDYGRVGAQRFGVANSGAMDRLALAAANTLVGNPPETAAIEFMLLGGRFTVTDGALPVAVAGALCPIAVGGDPAPFTATILLKAGETLLVGPMQAGVYAYLAVAGGFDVPPQLGSLSLHQRAALGGFHGRAFRAGDRVPLRATGSPERPSLALAPVALDAREPIRVVLGPQDDHFSEMGLRTFLESPYTVSREADRMGYRLSGPAIEHRDGFNIISDGIVFGSVQVPGAGEPIVTMADRQTTGGYPKIATVISADLRLVAQRRPGEALRFRAISIEEAETVARARAAEIAGLAARARPAPGLSAASEELLALNLAGAAVDALTPET